MSSRAEFQGGGYSLPQPVSVLGIPQHLRFDYALAGDESPKSLLLRVQLKEMNVISAACKFQAITTSNVLPKKRCAVLVQESEQTEKTESRNEQLSLLDRYAIVINIKDADRAVGQLEELNRDAA